MFSSNYSSNTPIITLNEPSEECAAKSVTDPRAALTIREVGPRDGFQSVPFVIPTSRKIEIITALLASGIRQLQLTSFMNPTRVPQVADAPEICRHFTADNNHPGGALTRFDVLVPTMKGAIRAMQSGAPGLSFVLSVSETHNRANVNRSTGESFSELKEIRNQFPSTPVKLDISTAFQCPFEGEVPLSKVIDTIAAARECGVTEMCICDTLGSAYPSQVKNYLSRISSDFSDIRFILHFHDTLGMGMANVLVALELGYRSFETSITGIGGCPFAPGAAGNLATEDLFYMAEHMGFKTGIDFEKLLATSNLVREILPGSGSSHVADYFAMKKQ